MVTHEYDPRMYVVSFSNAGCMYFSGISRPLLIAMTGMITPALQSASSPHIVIMSSVLLKSDSP